MPRDYKPARRPPRKKKKNANVRVFAAGFLTGAGVILAVYAAERFELLPLPSSADSGPRPQVVEPAVAEQRKPRFEFYTMLPEMEVAVSDEEIAPRVREHDKDEEPEPESLANAYLLQVGSFRRHEEADSLKASLALLGLEANIQTVSINGEETWYRVRVGPFSERAALNDARERLAANHLDALVLKRRI